MSCKVYDLNLGTIEKEHPDTFHSRINLYQKNDDDIRKFVEYRITRRLLL